MQRKIEYVNEAVGFITQTDIAVELPTQRFNQARAKL
jgi:hypothetical protein